MSAVKKLKIIFLDIDGVLNSERTHAEWVVRRGDRGYGGFFPGHERCGEEKIAWGHDLVNNLRRIVDETHAQIVISSTWRTFFTKEVFIDLFRVYGWVDAPVIDTTPISESGNRGHEILYWLTQRQIPPVQAYVILDDINAFLTDQLEYFIQTDPQCGLTPQDADRAIAILNQRKKRKKVK